MKLSQNDRILARLQRGLPITQEMCDHWYPKIKRLAARIYDLQARGHVIDERRIKTPGGASVSEYRLVYTRGNQGALFANPNR